MEFIFEDLWEPEKQSIERARYVSVLADSSTDSSTKDLESVYVRHAATGVPTNVFVGITELETVTAQGHKEAIERGTANVNIMTVKRKLYLSFSIQPMINSS